jgi:hypothetical protein
MVIPPGLFGVTFITYDVTVKRVVSLMTTSVPHLLWQSGGSQTISGTRVK